jgi:hypothetical protein
MHTITIFDFNEATTLRNWKVIDDVVMGGRSLGSFVINENGHGVFKGRVSLENNGGFSSIRYTNTVKIPKNYQKIRIRLKGDGKSYQFRLKPKRDRWESYVYNFSTTGTWQIIEIPLKEMYPSFRGRKLNTGNFDFDQIEEMGFLISNKQNEDFRLELDEVILLR